MDKNILITKWDGMTNLEQKSVLANDLLGWGMSIENEESDERNYNEWDPVNNLDDAAEVEARVNQIDSFIYAHNLLHVLNINESILTLEIVNKIAMASAGERMKAAYITFIQNGH